MMDVLITWDFEIRWFRTFSLFLMKAEVFWWCYEDLLCADVRGVGPKIITQKNPLRMNKTKRRQRDQCSEDEEQTTWLTAAVTSCFANTPFVRFAAVKAGGKEGRDAHHPEILKAAVQSAGLCSLFPVNYYVIGAWENKALCARLKLFDSLEELRCCSS